MKKQETIFIFAVACILLLIVFTIVFLAFRPEKSVDQLPITPPPSLSGSKTPTATPEPNTVSFDSKSEKILMDKLITKQPLSEQDSLARTHILSLLPSGSSSGVVYQNANVRIEYIEPVDEFKAQILTTNIDQAKEDAVNWFKENGFSQKGICDLPLNFIMSIATARYIHDNGITFNVLPKECQ